MEDKDSFVATVRFQDLSIAHSCTLLLYTKDKYIIGLAKKLRPEFHKILLVSSFDEVVACNEKHHYQSDGSGIDMILVDSDASSIKVLDYFYKRAKSEKFKSQPLVSTLVFLNEGSDSEFRKGLSNVGGANAIIMIPCQTRVVIDTILDLLHRKKAVDKLYQDIKNNNQHTKPFPFLPIFLPPEDPNNETKPSDTPELPPTTGSSSTARDTNIDDFAEELDDWTETSSLHPGYVQEIRDAVQGRRRGRTEGGEFNEEFDEFRNEFSDEEELSKDLIDEDSQDSNSLFHQRHQTDRILSKLLQHNPVHNLLTSEGKQLFQQAKEEQLNWANINGTPCEGSNIREGRGGARDNDSISESDSSSLQGGHSDPGSSSGIRKHRNGVVPHSSFVHKKRPVLANTLLLLESANRPKWGGATDGIAANSASNKLKQRSDPFERRNMQVAELELRTFVDKQPPRLEVSHTAGGLPIKTASACWKILKSDPYSFVNLNGSSNEQSNHNENDHLARKSSALISSSSLPQIHLPRKISTSNSSDKFLLASNPPTRPPSRQNSLESHGSNLSQSQQLKLKKYHSHPTLQNVHLSNNHHQLGSVPRNKASKLIHRISVETLPDNQLEGIIEIDLTNRKISIGDRELFESGRLEEMEENFEAATLVYKRASVSTRNKSSFLSKLFLGVCHFKWGKFMAAISFFSNAIQLLQELKDTALEKIEDIQYDLFTAHYNRGISSIRVGDDENALLDLTQAVKLAPMNIKAGRVLSIVQRRMGRYQDCIDSQLRLKSLHKEGDFFDFFNTDDLNSGKKCIGLKDSSEDQLPRKPSIPHFNRPKTTTSSSSSSPTRNRSNTATTAHSPVDLHRTMGGLRREDGSRGGSGSGESGGGNEEDSDTPRVVDTTIRLWAPNPQGGEGLKDLKIKALKEVDAEDAGMNEGQALSAFKLNNGLKLDLFDSIFVKPSPLQNALLKHPNRRRANHIEIIVSSLKLFPSLRSLSQSALEDLATCIEYRPIAKSGDILLQDTPAEAVFFLLRGHITQRLDGDSLETSNLPVGTINPFDTFGHIDILFNKYSENAHIVEEFLDETLPKHGNSFDPSIAEAAAAAIVASSGNLAMGHSHTINKSSTHLLDLNGGLHRAGIALPITTDKAVQAGVFASYSMNGVTELLLVGKSDWKRILYDATSAEFKSRLRTIRACGAFRKISFAEQIRLARMAVIRSFKMNECILPQGEKPDYLYLILSGVCLAKKRPNRIEVLQRKLVEIKTKAERHDLKYTYHHKLRHVLSESSTPIQSILGSTIMSSSTTTQPTSASNLVRPSSTLPTNLSTPISKSSSNSIFSPSLSASTHASPLTEPGHPPDSSPVIAGSSTLKPINILSETHVTVSEEQRYEWALEIQKLELAIEKAISQEEREREKEREKEVARKMQAAHEADGDESIFSQSSLQSQSHSPTTMNLSARSNVTLGSRSLVSDSEPEGKITPANLPQPQHVSSSSSSSSTSSTSLPFDRSCDVRNLSWPMLFGEACVLDPEHGVSLGSILADSSVEVLLIHRTQLQTFHLNELIIKDVRNRAVRYPSDRALVDSFHVKNNWMAYRHKLMDEINQDRWPAKVDAAIENFIF